MQHRFKRALLALMILAVAFSQPALALEFLFGGGPTNAPSASKIEDDGMLRVYLKSLGDPQALGLTLAGAYTVEGDKGFRFARDTEIALAADGGGVLLSVGGLTIDMGDSLTLTRHATDEPENGIYIHESEKDTLFEGDLTVTESGGTLHSVLNIQIEDYLSGVVAYEMSDSFPLEALKAQAVAARTYAMGKKWDGAGRGYDVVDTTQDQVYKGLDARYTNVLRAVEETRGIVGTYKGGFAMCYYAASNGGQTALASDIWGGSGDYGYLAMADDPYDLENPSSLVNSLTFSKTGKGSGKLWNMLEDALRALKLPEKGVKLESIASIEPAEPKFAGSRMYTKLRFTLSVTAKADGWTARDGDQTSPLFTDGTELQGDMLASVWGLSLARRGKLALPYVEKSGRELLSENPVVELDVYGDIKDGLSLGLNGSDCELVSAEQHGDSFTIAMRRFGHGVGMSQRGAQWMAGEHKKDYVEILKFYYPGMALEKIEWREVALAALADLPASLGRARPRPTPKPTPAPLPALEDGEYYATVTLESRASSLNVRQEPSTTARILSALDHGRRVIVSSDEGDGWVKIRTAELSGYVKLEYLKPA